MSNNTTPVSRDFHKVLLTGQSGHGKTYSFRAMDEGTTGFINVENKPLPFRKKFKYHARPINVASVYAAIEAYSNNPEIECIVIDSFSGFLELLLAQARKEKKNFEIWNLYNDEVGRFFTEVKKIRKEVFITSHYEILNIEGDPSKRVKVKGKEWEGLIEKEFTIVLYSEQSYDDKGKGHYYFRLSGPGTSAKCPPEIFGEDVVFVENDCKMIFDKILDFV